VPGWIRVRLETNLDEFHFGGRANILLILASLLLGIATHVVWDSFTHLGTWPYRHMEALRRLIHLPMVGWVQFYKILQHSSTILGSRFSPFAYWTGAEKTSALAKGGALQNRYHFCILPSYFCLYFQADPRDRVTGRE
jgi:hypothetical protein